MSKDHDIKIIPPKAAQKKPKKVHRKVNYMSWIIALVVLYYVLILLVVLVPMTGYMRITSLILGTVLLFDFHHSIKHYVKQREQ